MKKMIRSGMAILLVLSLCACGKENAAVTVTESREVSSGITEPETTSFETTEPEQETESTEGTAASDGQEGTTPITLTIGDTVFSGYLNDSAPAQSLISQLPMTVTLNDSGNDFCGDSLDITYSDNDVQSGYENGDLAFWPPASNFVIFVDDEENSASTGNLVMLGKITEPQEALDALEGRIDVTIALADAKEEEKESADDSADIKEGEVSEMQIKITVGDTELFASLENNATTQAIVGQMPMTLPMMDLYGREMCYRYGAYALPTDNLQSDGYEVGDIAYWAPGGSLVILYEQNGEQFERQHLGHIDSGVEIFQDTGDVDVTFELVE